MPVKGPTQSIINHIALVVDRSYSMTHLQKEVVRVVDAELESLKSLSQKLNQETRATVYVFDDAPECIFYDMDVLRFKTLAGQYHIGENTALIDAVLQAISDLQQTPQIYGDHAFFVIVITDGQENRSKNTNNVLRTKLLQLPDNWTVPILVPDYRGQEYAIQVGFTPGNIRVWDTKNVAGLRDAGEAVSTVTTNFMNNRAMGIRGSKSVFQLNSVDLSTNIRAGNLQQVARDKYAVLPVFEKRQIGEFVQAALGNYVLGSGYYQLTKPEEIQAQKRLVLRAKTNGMLFTGANIRKELGLPDYTVKVYPEHYTDYDVFVQSTSVNRNLVPGTSLLVLK